ncbi:hypothetical protein [Peribacillus muralis]|uniref:hypothetical protein n=1 Tax=Peribacillus muralis TaxID=264697 RepID=UPI003671E63A
MVVFHAECSESKRSEHKQKKLRTLGIPTHAKWNETEGGDTPAGNAVYVRPRRLKDEEAHGPPAERERL